MASFNTNPNDYEAFYPNNDQQQMMPDQAQSFYPKPNTDASSFYP
jgi:hypothetical protein